MINLTFLTDSLLPFFAKAATARSRSACVIVWLAEQLIESPGARLAGAPGQLSSLAMSSSTVIGWWIVSVPVFVTRN